MATRKTALDAGQEERIDDLFRLVEEAFADLKKEIGYVVVYRSWEEDEETKKKREKREIYYRVGGYTIPSPLADSQDSVKERATDFIDRLVNDYTRYAKEADGSYIRDIVIRKRPGYVLGYGVLGRTWPSLKVVEIREGLYGKAFTEVLLHELTHIENPYASEYTVRVLTRQKLLARGDQPFFHH